LRSPSEEIYQQGLARLEAGLVQGPVQFTSKYTLLLAKKPGLFSNGVLLLEDGPVYGKPGN